MLDQLNLGEMPPRKATSHPSNGESRAVIDSLSAILKTEYTRRRSTNRKIDPMGFAMENFNAVGMWRDSYPDTKKKIDPSSTLSNGKKLGDILAFKKHLLTRQDDVTRCLAEKLLTYSSGRVLEPGDRGKIDCIVEDVKARGCGLRDLVKRVAQSEVFLTK